MAEVKSQVVKAEEACGTGCFSSPAFIIFLIFILLVFGVGMCGCCI
ncbi:MAG: hypothetical protein A4E52_00634 [Pelotomaculum sp. PtaB.Bin013]|uniref:Uncharacterized protein n=1 Tax=Pelotomaculum isophthalicicum JI TaxID=947010 RepID=A0A9X4H0N6_9FIRM|nr:hypothetical protein [Pelotomaculum isophthalicicum]MDF9406901.1 hypothetical protein [Pelotomaculum isophthalicicum JI]OPX91027.1 MAG: hypothetical protein A4E52_00634 [Pelotomaculum sp. PtaB.Bin013]